MPFASRGCRADIQHSTRAQFGDERRRGAQEGGKVQGGAQRLGFVRRERHVYRRGGGPSRLRISPGDLRFCWAKTTSMMRPWNSRRSMSSFASCAWSMLVNSTKANGFGRLRPQGVGRGRGGVSGAFERVGQLWRESTWVCVSCRATSYRSPSGCTRPSRARIARNTPADPGCLCGR
jgi:hypothetical protein